ncbi:hypothetical protein SLEP1_g60091 [Rubroshorea leprosula]|uniref:Uncharacterized protein n=1 Tax=Rubroshorea leprosula TaxID=152421 RepID=A0AAV5MVE5_9ROSI|nr:hypothetical protein SLEP1_g60091 [Rubroshorea leprosula]
MASQSVTAAAISITKPIISLSNSGEEQVVSSSSSSTGHGQARAPLADLIEENERYIEKRKHVIEQRVSRNEELVQQYIDSNVSFGRTRLVFWWPNL